MFTNIGRILRKKHNGKKEEKKKNGKKKNGKKKKVNKNYQAKQKKKT